MSKLQPITKAQFFTELAAAEKARDDYLSEIGSCMDGYCVIKKPVGMHTNGGCRCPSDRYRMQRFAYAHNRFADELRALRAALTQDKP